MRYQKIGMYVIILCIIFSIGIRNDSQIVKDTGFHNQVEQKQILQNNYLQNTILTKTNTKQEKSQTHLMPARSQTDAKVETNSNVTGFISTWQTNMTSSISSNEFQIKLPLVSDGVYDFNVSWGDGSSNLITTYNQSAITHNYGFSGIYTLNITGIIDGWNFNRRGDALKLIQISNWGPLRLGNSGYYFSGATNLVVTAKDTLDLIGTTDLAGLFENCYSLGSSGDLNSWNVSQVTNMSNMFKISPITIGVPTKRPTFNQSLDLWNVSNVTDMNGMFYDESSFNQPLNSWDVSKVTKMKSMFSGTSFNQPLDTWNVSQVTDISAMFAYAPFNQPLNSWDVSHVTDMSNFLDSTTFNQPLNSWNVSQVTNMSSMFNGAGNFNRPLNSWNVSKVTDMNSLFSGTGFNQLLDSWNVSQVTDMSDMFYTDYSINQSIDSWNVSKVTEMGYMFGYATNFNQPLDLWDVSHVIDMSGMFYNATSFNQPLGSWNVSQVTDMSNMFAGNSLSISNYDNLLLGWSSQSNLQYNVVFDAGRSQYSVAAQNAREKLINKFGWTITDGGIFEISCFTSLGILILSVIAVTAVIGISSFVLIAYFEYKKSKIKEHKKDLKYLNYIKKTAKFSRHKNFNKKILSNDTFDKIEQIIDENKEK